MGEKAREDIESVGGSLTSMSLSAAVFAPAKVVEIDVLKKDMAVAS